MSLDLEYFYGNEAEQYSFYRIPKTLFKELDMGSGIGLIERRKQGQGKPARVYVKKFTLAALYNAPVTMDHYYTTQVSHDMAQGWGAGA